jgi:hypothetical protein
LQKDINLPKIYGTGRTIDVTYIFVQELVIKYLNPVSGKLSDLLFVVKGVVAQSSMHIHRSFGFRTRNDVRRYGLQLALFYAICGVCLASFSVTCFLER